MSSGIRSVASCMSPTVTKDPSLLMDWVDEPRGLPRLEPHNYDGIASFAEVVALSAAYRDPEEAAFCSWVCGWDAGNGFSLENVRSGCKKWHKNHFNTVRLALIRGLMPVAWPGSRRSTLRVVNETLLLASQPDRLTDDYVRAALRDPTVAAVVANLTPRRVTDDVASSFRYPEVDPWSEDAG